MSCPRFRHSPSSKRRGCPGETSRRLRAMPRRRGTEPTGLVNETTKAGWNSNRALRSRSRTARGRPARPGFHRMIARRRGVARHEDVHLVLGLGREPVSLVQPAGRTALQHVQPNHGVFEVAPFQQPAQNGSTDALALQIRVQVEVLQPVRVLRRPQRHTAGHGAIHLDHPGVRWGEPGPATAVALVVRRTARAARDPASAPRPATRPPPRRPPPKPAEAPSPP